MMELLCKGSSQILAVNIFAEKLHHRCLTVSQTRLRLLYRPFGVLKLNFYRCVANVWFAKFNQSSDFYRTASGKFIECFKIHLNRGSSFNICILHKKIFFVNKQKACLAKSFFMLDGVLNMSLVLTVAGYWESISSKAKILFNVFAKKTKSAFILDNGSNYKINDGPNEKTVFVLEKSNRENYGCRMNAWIFRRDITHFIPIHPFIFNAFRNSSVVILEEFQNPVKHFKWSILQK